jgi:hypothetical protein
MRNAATWGNSATVLGPYEVEQVVEPTQVKFLCDYEFVKKLHPNRKTFTAALSGLIDPSSIGGSLGSRPTLRVSRRLYDVKLESPFLPNS